MASVYDIKPRFQALLRPIAGALARAGVSANAVTVSACAASVLFGAALLAAPGAPVLLMALGPFLFVRMAMNAIDGLIAKEHHDKSARGAILNELCDMISDAALYLPLALIPGVSGAALVGAVTAGLMAEAAGILSFHAGAPRRYDGPFGKSDRAALFGALAFGLGLGLAPGGWLTALLLVAALAGAWTIRNRVAGALRAAS